MGVVRELGRAAGTGGWRGAVTERLAPVVARRTALRPDDVRVLMGLAFFGLAVMSLARTVRHSLRAAADQA